MKIATWNVNSLTVRLPQVLDWLHHNPVDALCLQELKMEADRFPYAEIEAAGYHAAVHGQKTYNGVAILSRQPAQHTVSNIPGFADEQARLVTCHFDSLTLVNGYFVNGQEPGSDKFAYKMRWLTALRQYLHGLLQEQPHLLLAGDFNITADDRDSYDPQALAETIHHTTEEREHLNALYDMGLLDTFRQKNSEAGHYSWWDYRAAAFRRNRGLRIDYVLASQPLCAALTDCTIDRQTRKNERPSDHVPVVASFDWPTGLTTGAGAATDTAARET